MNQEYTYQIKGINSDTETCEICERTDLKKVVWIVEIDEDGNETSSPVAHGTNCASRKLGFNGKNTKALNNRQINEAHAEHKKQARLNYFNNQCILVDRVYIDRKWRIGLVMRENNIDRNAAIQWIRSQMNDQWFMK